MWWRRRFSDLYAPATAAERWVGGTAVTHCLREGSDYGKLEGPVAIHLFWLNETAQATGILDASTHRRRFVGPTTVHIGWVVNTSGGSVSMDASMTSKMNSCINLTRRAVGTHGARDEDRCGRSEYFRDSIQDVRVESAAACMHASAAGIPGADSSSRPKVMSPGSGINTYSPRSMHGKSAHSCRKDLARSRPCHRMRLRR